MLCPEKAGGCRKYTGKHRAARTGMNFLLFLSTSGVVVSLLVPIPSKENRCLSQHLLLNASLAAECFLISQLVKLLYVIFLKSISHVTALKNGTLILMMMSFSITSRHREELGPSRLIFLLRISGITDRHRTKSFEIWM